MILKKYFFIILFPVFFYNPSYSQTSESGNQTGMLILGSAHEETTKKRVQVGYDLFMSEIEFDYIIVAGGCGAHGSDICEAEIMEKILREKGVPGQLIFKEDKSRSTAQNYCYSKRLKKADGTPIIMEGDQLYIVSNHWHAISVAGCFNQQDAVRAQYHIEGSIEPKETDKTDYVNIFRNCTGNEFFCSSLLWPLIDASYFRPLRTGGENVLFVEDIEIHGNSGFDNAQASKISDSQLELPSGWEKGIDAAFFDHERKKLYYFKGDQYLEFSPDLKADKNHPQKIGNMISNLPENWEGGHFDASFMYPEEAKLFLFKGTEYVKVSTDTWRVERGYPRLIKDLVKQWPFQWAEGSIDAANFDSQNNKVFLFRGSEVLRASWRGQNLVPDPEYPRKTPLKWPEEIFTEKP